MDLPICRCGHAAGLHLLSDKSPRTHRGCSVHEDGTKCPCVKYAPEVTHG